MRSIQTEKLSRIKKLVSLISILAIVSTAAFAVVFLAIHIPFLAGFSALSCASFLLTYFMNKSGRVELSRALILINGLITIFTLCAYTPANFGFDLLFLALIAAAFAFHDFKEFKITLLYVVVGTLAFTMLELFIYKEFYSSITGNMHAGLFYFMFVILTFIFYNTQKVAHIAEEKYMQSEERYHKMVAEVKDYSIILLDNAGIVQNWNQGAEKIKGYTAEEITGKNFRAFYTKEDNEANKPGKFLETAVKEGTAHEEGWLLRKDGTPFWAVVNITALHDTANNITGFSNVTRDITEKKKAEDTLMQQARLIKMLPDGILYGTNERTIVSLNEAAAKMLGVTKEEITGRDMGEFMRIDLMNDTMPGVREELRKNGYWRGESEITTREGKKLRVLMSVLKTDNIDGEADGWIAIYTDISPLQVNQELKAALERLEQHTRYLEQFSYISSHDLKAPINIIQGLTNYLVEGKSVNDEQKETCSMLKKTVDGMQRTYTSLNQILKLRKSLVEKTSLVSEAAPVRGVLDEALVILQPEIQKAGAQINIDMEGISKVNLAPVYFKSICQNLISNSIKYRASERPLKIGISVRRVSDNEMVFVVEDNGIGMDLTNNRHKLFGLFKRLHSHVEGEGVGLHIVKSIVDAYGGSIGVTSAPNAGSRFELRFKNINFMS